MSCATQAEPRAKHLHRVRRCRADVLDGRENVVVVDHDRVSLPRQARDALSGCRQVGVQGGPWSRSSRGCCKPVYLPFLSALRVLKPGLKLCTAEDRLRAQLQSPLACDGQRAAERYIDVEFHTAN